MNLSPDINITRETMEIVQKGDKDFFLKAVGTFLIVFTTAGYISFGAPGFATFMNYTKTTAAKFSKFGRQLAKFIVKHPLLSTAAAAIVADKTGLIDLPEPPNIAKLLGLGAGAYFLFKVLESKK